MVENFSFNDNDDIEEAMNNFISSFKQITDMHAPLRLNSQKEQKLVLKPWITKGILKSIKTKNRLFNQCYKRNNSDLITQFRWYSNKLTTVKRIAKQDYFMSLLLESRNNVSQQWKIINKILEKNQKKTNVINKLVTDNGIVLTDSKAICNKLNNFFVSIGPIMASKISNYSRTKPLTTVSSCEKTFFFEPITSYDVWHEIYSSNQKKAVGYDGIPIYFIKLAGEPIAALLALIFNKCVTTGVYPTCLKQAKVTPIHKGGIKHISTNYRPISVLSSFSKFFERLIYNRLDKYLAKFNLLSDKQFGFRNNYSTVHAACDVYTQSQAQKDQKLHTCLILLDLSKAFDSVDHDILLKKLHKFGLRGSFGDMLKSYLHNRSQYVQIGEDISSNTIN